VLSTIANGALARSEKERVSDSFRETFSNSSSSLRYRAGEIVARVFSPPRLAQSRVVHDAQGFATCRPHTRRGVLARLSSQSIAAGRLGTTLDRLPPTREATRGIRRGDSANFSTSTMPDWDVSGGAVTCRDRADSRSSHETISVIKGLCARAERRVRYASQPSTFDAHPPLPGRRE
jgi:hypothetical protein